MHNGFLLSSKLTWLFAIFPVISSIKRRVYPKTQSRHVSPSSGWHCCLLGLLNLLYPFKCECLGVITPPKKTKKLINFSAKIHCNVISHMSEMGRMQVKWDTLK